MGRKVKTKRWRVVIQSKVPVLEFKITVITSKFSRTKDLTPLTEHG